MLSKIRNLTLEDALDSVEPAKTVRIIHDFSQSNSGKTTANFIYPMCEKAGIKIAGTSDIELTQVYDAMTVLIFDDRVLFEKHPTSLVVRMSQDEDDIENALSLCKERRNTL